MWVSNCSRLFRGWAEPNVSQLQVLCTVVQHHAQAAKGLYIVPYTGRPWMTATTPCLDQAVKQKLEQTTDGSLRKPGLKAGTLFSCPFFFGLVYALFILMPSGCIDLLYLTLLINVYAEIQFAIDP